MLAISCFFSHSLVYFIAPLCGANYFFGSACPGAHMAKKEKTGWKPSFFLCAKL